MIASWIASGTNVVGWALAGFATAPTGAGTSPGAPGQAAPGGGGPGLAGRSVPISRIRSISRAARASYPAGATATIFRSALRAAKANGVPSAPRQRHSHRDQLSRREIDRWQRQRLVDDIAALPPGLRVDRDICLL